MYVANVLRQISNSNGLWTGSHIPATDKKSNNYYFCGIIFKMEIHLPCVVIAPNINTVYKSYIGCQERILSCRVLFHTVKPRFAPDTRLIQTPHFDGQFALCLRKESSYILSKVNPLNSDTPFIRTLSMVPSVSVLTEFDCVLCTSHCTGTMIMQGPLYNMTP